MANIFISHRADDSVLAETLAAKLRALDHYVWLDTWELNIGDEIAEKMNDGLEGSTYVVVCYSSAGLAPWMSIEVWSSVTRQLNGCNVKILPVILSLGGSPPALLAGKKYANLAKDWDRGVDELVRAIDVYESRQS